MPLHRRVNSPTLAVVARNLVPQQAPAVRRFALHEPRTTVHTGGSTANRRQRPDGPIVHGVSVILTATPIRDQTFVPQATQFNRGLTRNLTGLHEV